MFRYISIILREFQSCISLKLRNYGIFCFSSVRPDWFCGHHVY